MAGKQLHKHIPGEERVREEAGEARSVARAPSASPAALAAHLGQQSLGQRWRVPAEMESTCGAARSGGAQMGERRGSEITQPVQLSFQRRSLL